MKRLPILLLAVLTTLSAFTQDITGQWNGVLQVQGIQLHLVFHITKTGDTYSATMDSPDQGAKDIPVTTTTYQGSKLKLEIPAARIEYTGDFAGDSITGTFKQGNLSTPMNLAKGTIAVAKKPQEPVEPYPYYAEEVTFPNTKAGITLAGTLTLPSKEGKFPVVVLITGSGPQNRDEELLGHKPFLVLSDYLTRHGIGVLRYDDRGVAKSTGKFATATSADFATDAESAVAYLKTRKEVEEKHIGLMGHSEGGIIAPMVAATSKDISFIVLLAGTGIRGDKLLLLQQELIARASGSSAKDIEQMKAINTKVFDMMVASSSMEKLKADVTVYMDQLATEDSSILKSSGMTKADFVRQQAEQVSSPWMYYFIKYDPAPTLQKVKCPVLAVNGDKDLQVPAKENLTAIRAALEKGGNKNVTTKELPGLNHLFQECKTGAPSEYAQIEQTFSPKAMEEITQWIQKQVK